MLAVLLALLLAVAVQHASATVLSAGGEDVDFTCPGTCTTDTTAGRFRSDWARSAYRFRDLSVVDPPPSRGILPNFSPQSSIWVHGRYFNLSNNAGDPATSANSQLLRVMGADGNPAIVIRATGTNGQVKISKRSAAGTFTDLVTCSSSTFPTGGLDQFDMSLDYAVAGSVTLYVGTSSFCTYSGDVTTDGRTQVQAVELSAARVGLGGTSGGAWSEVIVSTLDTRSKTVLRGTATGNGNSIEFSGTNVCTAIFPSNPYDDAAVATSATAEEVQECTVFSTIPAGTFTVDAVVQSARASRGSSGPQNVQFVVRTGGADYPSASSALSINPGVASVIWQFNPATGSFWSTGDITDAGFNAGVKSKP